MQPRSTPNHLTHRNESRADVIVIGAGVAGSAAAIHLARAGRRVMLIEKRRHPRDKTCGGCLSGRAVGLLRELLPADEQPGIAGTKIDFCVGRYRLRVESDGANRLVSRRELDQRLVEAAVAAGATLIDNTPARLERSEDGWHVIAGATRIHAHTILIAAGIRSCADSLGIRGRSQRRRMLAQSWVQPLTPELPRPGHVEMHWLRGGYVGLSTFSARECQIGFAADAPRVSAPVWSHLRALNPRCPLWIYLPADAPQRFGAQGAAGFPWAPEQLGAGNCLLIGDAAGYVEPLTGEGMGQALFSARCAAEAILNGADVLASYTQQMRLGHRSVQRRLGWLGGALRNPVVQWAAQLPPLIPQRWLAPLVARVHVGLASESG